MSGITKTGEATCLAAILPGGSNRYVGLFTALPADNGTGGTEVSDATYARVACSAWLDAVIGAFTYRKNNATATFPAFTAAVDGVVGWGIWDALTVGNLLACGPITDEAGVAISRDFVAGDIPRFLTGELKVGLN